MATVFTFVLGSALGPAATASLTRKLGRDGDNAEDLLRDHMVRARELATQFPQLRTRLGTAAADYGAAPEHSFEFGLQAILDGLEAQRNTRPMPAHQHAGKHPATTKNRAPRPLPGHSRGQDLASEHATPG